MFSAISCSPHEIHILLPEDPVARPQRRIAVRLRPRDDVAQRRTGLGLGQAHGAGKAAVEHRPHEGFDLRRGTVRQQQVRVGCREQRVAGTADVGGEEISEAGLVHHQRQLHAAIVVVGRGGEQACCRKGLEGRFHLGNEVDSFAVEPRLLDVALAPVRQEYLGGDALRRIERGIEGLARMIGETRPVAERPHVQPFIEQELEIPPGNQLGTHQGIIPTAREHREVVE